MCGGQIAHVFRVCMCVWVRVCVWATDHSQESQRALLLMLLEAFLFPVFLSPALFSHPLILSSLSPLILFHLRPLIRSLSTMGAKDKYAALGFSVSAVCKHLCLCLWGKGRKTTLHVVRNQNAAYLTMSFIQNHGGIILRWIWYTCFITVWCRSLCGWQQYEAKEGAICENRTQLWALIQSQTDS